MSAPSPYPQKLSRDALSAFLSRAFPSAAARGVLPEIDDLASGYVRLILQPGDDSLRPGDLVSGPTLMGLADTAAYAVVISAIGDQPMALTHTLSISFLRPCVKGAVTCEARLLKLGRRLATVDARIHQSTPDAPIAQATVGYALP